MSTRRTWMIVGLAMLLAAVLPLASCKREPATTGQRPVPAPGQVNLQDLDDHFVFWQDVPAEMGGGKVLCVWARDFNGGGPSCDWPGYHLANSK